MPSATRLRNPCAASGGLQTPAQWPYHVRKTHHKSDARGAVMGKTNWKRVFLGGVVARVVFNIIMFAASAIYLDDLFVPALEALNPNYQATTGSLII